MQHNHALLWKADGSDWLEQVDEWQPIVVKLSVTDLFRPIKRHCSSLQSIMTV
uniref:Uncharacterized protein n=1 Tax=Anguilla anguilla TaxID=7936 RepID=A0A0E9XMT7_ANGAN